MLSLHSPFTTWEHGILSASYNDGLGVTHTTLTGTYLPVFAASIEDIDYLSAIDTLASELQSDYGGTWVGTYNNVSNGFSISGSVQTNLVWSDFAKLVFGFQDTLALTNVVTSSKQPGFIWRASLNGRVSETRVFDNGPSATEQLSVDGRSFSLVKSGSAKLEAWEFRYEPKKTMFNTFSGSTAPWTYQRHIEHVGARKPWVYLNTNNATIDYSDRTAVYKYTEFGSSFNPVSSFFGSTDHAYNVNVEAVQINALTDAEIAGAKELTINRPDDLVGLSAMYWPISASLSGTLVLELTSSVSGNHLAAYGGTGFPTYDASDSYFNSNPSISLLGGSNSYFSSFGSGSMAFTAGQGGSLVMFYTVDRHLPEGTLLQVDTQGTFNLARLEMHDQWRKTRMKLQKTDATTFDTVSQTTDLSTVTIPTFAVARWSDFADPVDGLKLYWSTGDSIEGHQDTVQEITGSQSFDDAIAAPTIVFSVGGVSDNVPFTFGFAAIYDRPLTTIECEVLRDWLLEDLGYV